MLQSRDVRWEAEAAVGRNVPEDVKRSVETQRLYIPQARWRNVRYYNRGEYYKELGDELRWLSIGASGQPTNYEAYTGSLDFIVLA